MDRIEQVAGIKILAMETAIGTIIGDNGVNCCFRMGKGQAELCVRAAAKPIKTVDRLQQALCGSRPTPKSGGFTHIHRQPAEENGEVVARCEIAPVEIKRGGNGVYGGAAMPCPALPRQFFQQEDEFVGAQTLHESDRLFRRSTETFKRISDSQNIIDDGRVLLGRRRGAVVTVKKQPRFLVLQGLKTGDGFSGIESDLFLSEGCRNLDGIAQMPDAFDLMSGCICGTIDAILAIGADGGKPVVGNLLAEFLQQAIGLCHLRRGRFFSAISQNPGGNAACNGHGGNVLRHHGACGNNCAAPYLHAIQHNRIGADPDVVADLYPERGQRLAIDRSFNVVEAMVEADDANM